MKAEKDPKTRKWFIQYRYTDWQGARKKSTKRGFSTKREAEAWLRDFLTVKQSDFNMKFEDFIKLYYADMEKRLQENTMHTKKYIIDLKILPYFKNLQVGSIKPANVRAWQNALIQQSYSPTYLKTIHNQLSCLFNYAVRYYDREIEPLHQGGQHGQKQRRRNEVLDEVRVYAVY